MAPFVSTYITWDSYIRENLFQSLFYQYRLLSICILNPWVKIQLELALIIPLWPLRVSSDFLLYLSKSLLKKLEIHIAISL